MLGSDAKIMEFMTYAGLLIMGGRDINGNHLAMDFLLSQEDETKVILAELLSLKKDNEQDVQAVVKFVDSLIKDYEGNGFIYYDAEDQIPYKLLGYAASHTTTKLMIPALFLKKKDNQILCEGRCGSGFSILEAYSYCSDTLTQFGGHVKAAGFTMIPENLNEFIFQFNGFLQMSDESIKKNMTIKVDTSISLNDLTKDLWNQLQELQPFGMGNPSPIFHLKATKADVEKKGLQIIGIKHHCKIAEIIFHWTEFDKISVIDYH
jgi:single-stranded-DNA-specific exonuclease